MRIVGLGHYSRTGKDTFANAFIDWVHTHSPLRAVKIPFAWKLKQICHELYEWAGVREPEFYDTPEGEPYRDIVLPDLGMTPVELWIKVGTPCFRDQIHPMTWINYVLKNAHDADIVVIPDVRFPNETEAVLLEGGILNKIVRPGYGPRNTVSDKALLGYRGWHYVWGASGSINRLIQDARRLAEGVCGFSEMPAFHSDEHKDAACSVERIAA